MKNAVIKTLQTEYLIRSFLTFKKLEYFFHMETAKLAACSRNKELISDYKSDNSENI